MMERSDFITVFYCFSRILLPPWRNGPRFAANAILSEVWKLAKSKSAYKPSYRTVSEQLTHNDNAFDTLNSITEETVIMLTNNVS